MFPQIPPGTQQGFLKIFIWLSTPNSRPFPMEQPHQPNVNHFVYSNFDLKVSNKTLLLINLTAKQFLIMIIVHLFIHFIRHSICLCNQQQFINLSKLKSSTIFRDCTHYKIFKLVYYVF